MTRGRTRRQAASTEIVCVAFWLAAAGALAGSAGCAPVRPEQRAILADKIMQFGANARARAALDHALENREGSSGGGAAEGGGCGCN
jgi:Domain of unknown function (DUF4266)